jgi:hypothetical protein
VWAIGPGYWAAIVVLEAGDPHPPDYYRQLLPAGMGLAHVTVEVRDAPDRELLATPPSGRGCTIVGRSEP